jgi:hypothetical protein
VTPATIAADRVFPQCHGGAKGTTEVAAATSLRVGFVNTSKVEAATQYCFSATHTA